MMAEIQTHLPDSVVTVPKTATSSEGHAKRRQPSLSQLHKQPAPLRIFPFPTLTSNPVSWVHLAAVWLGHVFSPPPSEPSVVHTAYWDLATRSLVVTDANSMADLWQQGFYGKGSLSRSDPNWLKREQIRLGVAKGRVSEVNTDKRREDRARAKWERARAEQDALEQRRLTERSLLAEVEAVVAATACPTEPSGRGLRSPVGPMELLAMPNSLAELAARSEDGMEASVDESGSSGNDDAESNTTISSDSTGTKRLKSVRFSPNVESTVFDHTDPPSPGCSASSSSLRIQLVAEPETVTIAQGIISDVPAGAAAPAVDAVEVTIVNKEHLQLAPQEAFFLTFALGALRVVDALTQSPISTADLLTLLRQHSYYPPRTPQSLQLDDPFLIHYAVYHHFRSLGWVPRAGIKFGVDWLLYARGPAFDHAEYGLLVLPSYSDPYWKAEGRQAARKSWHWMMGVNRVLSKVYKSLVLVYVEVPPPTSFGAGGELGDGLVDLLKRYRIREHTVKRWSSNRNRNVK